MPQMSRADLLVITAISTSYGVHGFVHVFFVQFAYPTSGQIPGQSFTFSIRDLISVWLDCLFPRMLAPSANPHSRIQTSAEIYMALLSPPNTHR
jgi:hypothetical protein